MLPKIKEFKYLYSSTVYVKQIPNVEILNFDETKITLVEIEKLVESKILDNVRKLNMDINIGQLYCLFD